MAKSKELKRREAEERAELRKARSSKAQLLKLLREGHGHCKEANRLREVLKENKDG